MSRKGAFPHRMRRSIVDQMIRLILQSRSSICWTTLDCDSGWAHWEDNASKPISPGSIKHRGCLRRMTAFGMRTLRRDQKDREVSRAHLQESRSTRRSARDLFRCPLALISRSGARRPIDLCMQDDRGSIAYSVKVGDRRARVRRGMNIKMSCPPLPVSTSPTIIYCVRCRSAFAGAGPRR
jgi:hypothetical protein